MWEIDKKAQDILFRSARTISRFAAEPVTEDHLRAIYDLVKYAPTSLNQQPLRVVVVPAGQARERLATHMWGHNKPKTAGAPASLILAADLEFHENLRGYAHMFPVWRKRSRTRACVRSRPG